VPRTRQRAAKRRGKGVVADIRETEGLSSSNDFVQLVDMGSRRVMSARWAFISSKVPLSSEADKDDPPTGLGHTKFMGARQE
jgi:hypothetical protein